jgi:hypothetical protein
MSFFMGAGGTGYDNVENDPEVLSFLRSLRTPEGVPFEFVNLLKEEESNPNPKEKGNIKEKNKNQTL